MKKILFFLLLVSAATICKGQSNPFPSTDSLERFINRYIRNSPVEAFQNLRMNTTLIGLLRFIQGSEIGSGVDTMYLVGGCILRLTTGGGDTINVSLCNKLDSVTIETATNPNPDTLFEWKNGTRSLVGLIPKGGGASGQITTVVRKPLIVYKGDSALNIPDSIDVLIGRGLALDDDSVLVADTTVMATLDTAFAILTRALLVIDTIEYVHDGSSSATYQNDKLIGAKLLQIWLENYQVSFITRSGTCYMDDFDIGTGEITLANGFFSDDDWVKIIYRHYAIFLVDGDGDLVTDENGNYIILN